MAHILMIDDEKGICLEFKEIMEDEGHEVEFRTNGRDGIEAVKSKKFDVVFLDVLMPGLEGREVFERIRQISNVPIVIMSGYMPPHKESAVLNLGASACLKKPLDLEEVKNLIHSLSQKQDKAESL